MSPMEPYSGRLSLSCSQHTVDKLGTSLSRRYRRLGTDVILHGTAIKTWLCRNENDKAYSPAIVPTNEPYSSNMTQV